MSVVSTLSSTAIGVPRHSSKEAIVDLTMLFLFTLVGLSLATNFRGWMENGVRAADQAWWRRRRTTVVDPDIEARLAPRYKGQRVVGVVVVLLGVLGMVSYFTRR